MRCLGLLAFGAMCLSAVPGLAQIQQLPATSRSEAQTNAISRSLGEQGQDRAAAQQNQFEINSLRTESSVRPAVTAPPIVGPAPLRR